MVVVTGGGAGIGGAIASELGRSGAHVVTLDPMTTLDGSSRVPDSGPTTAERIVKEGGSARASEASVTDPEAVAGLFDELVEEFGALDAVINVAGISRPTDFASGSEEDWSAVLGVHLGGYLNVLGAALPRMAAAGHGRVLGVTSGSGWRPANTGAYGCAKRAVAALTWQIGRVAPPGVTVNALAPMAETRMVTAARASSAASDREGRAKSGGVSLAAAPPPEHLGPIGAYLASEAFAWASGQVIFSNGAEVARVSSPHLLEVCRTSQSRSLPHLFDTVLPLAFAPVERAQATNGAGNPRFPGVFTEPGSSGTSGAVRRAVVVTDHTGWGQAVAAALVTREVTCLSIGSWQGGSLVAGEPASDFAGAIGQLTLAVRQGGPIDAVVVALSADASPGPVGPEWGNVLAEHATLPGRIRTDAAWARAVADYAAQAERPVRLVTLVDAMTSGGVSRGQAAAQLARSARGATSEHVDAFALCVETAAPTERRTAAELAAHLLCVPEAAALSGAELVVSDGWVGLQSHPAPETAISYGGPALPSWFDAILRRAATGRSS